MRFETGSATVIMPVTKRVTTRVEKGSIRVSVKVLYLF